MSEWISVKDKGNFPAFGQVCDVKGLDTKGVAIAYICPEYSNLMWHDEDDEPVPFQATHWKPHEKNG